MEQRVQDYKDMVNRKTTEELLTEAEDKRKGVEKHIDELVRLEMLEGGRTLEEEQKELEDYAEVMGEEAAKRLGYRLHEKRKKRLMEREGVLAPEEEYPGKLEEVEEATKELEDMLLLHPEEEDDLVKELEGEDSDAESTCTVVAAKEVEEWNSDASTVKNRIEVWEVVDPATIDPEVLAKKEEEAAKGLYHGKSRNARRRKNYAEKLRCAANNIGQPTSRARGGFVDLEEEAYQKELYEEERYKAMKKKIELNMKDRERKNKRKVEENKRKTEEKKKKEEDMARRFVEREPEERNMDNRELWLGERKMQIAQEAADDRARSALMVEILTEEREMLDDLFDEFLLTKNITHYKQWTEELKEEWFGIKAEVQKPRREREEAVEQLKKDRLELMEDVDSELNEEIAAEIEELDELLKDRVLPREELEPSKEEMKKLPFLYKIDVHDVVQYPETQEEIDALAKMWLADDAIGERLNFSWSVKGVAKKDQVEGMTDLMARCARNRVSECNANDYMDHILSKDTVKVSQGLIWHFQNIITRIFINGGGGDKNALEELVERERKRIGLFHFSKLKPIERENAVAYVRADINTVASIKPSLSKCFRYYAILLHSANISSYSQSPQTQKFGNVRMPRLSRNQRRRGHQLNDMYKHGGDVEDEGCSEAYSNATAISTEQKREALEWIEKEETRREELEETIRKNDARRVITERRVANIRRFGKYNLNKNRKDISVKQKQAYKEVDYLRQALTKAETKLYNIEKDKRGILKKEERVQNCRIVAKSLEDPIEKPKRIVIEMTLSELIDKQEKLRKETAGQLESSDDVESVESQPTEIKRKKRKIIDKLEENLVLEATEQEKSTDDMMPIEPQPKKPKAKESKPIEKLGTRRTVLEKANPEEESPSNLVANQNNTLNTRNIINDDSSFKFSSEQTRRLFLRCREKWESMGKAQMPSTGPPQPICDVSKPPSTPSTRKERRRWVIAPSSSAKIPSKPCSDGSKKRKKNKKKQKLVQPGIVPTLSLTSTASSGSTGSSKGVL